MKKIKLSFSRTQIIALGFFAIIAIGSLLLLLPVSTRAGETTTLLDAVFTATSATCVTGLIVHDTYSHWTAFGQVVIITLIQIGGLGFITLRVFALMILKRKIGLKNRELVHDSLNSFQVGGSVKLVKKILKGTLFFETAGALLLATRFVPIFGVLKGTAYAFFHSISAFCNAGFDIMGSYGEYSSLVPFYDDVIVNFTIMSLIAIGGIGFLVWDDLSVKKLCFKKYCLHTKIVLITTAILIFGGALLFYIAEKDNTLAGMDPLDTILVSLFSSVTPRTAGFNTVDTAALRDGSKTLTMLLMFIGGSPGSTAGGIKTTTFAAIFFFILSYVKHENGCNVFRRRLEDDTIKKASTIVFINLSLVVSAIIIILISQDLLLSDVAFEVFSAIGTVGMSTGVTRRLNSLSRVVIVLLMYCGRIGSLSFALSFTDSLKTKNIKYPVEKITIG